MCQPALAGDVHPPEGGGRVAGDVGPEVFPRQLFAALFLVGWDGSQDFVLHLVAEAQGLHAGADGLAGLRGVCPGGQRLSQLQGQHVLSVFILWKQGHAFYQLQHVEAVRHAQHLPLGNRDAAVVCQGLPQLRELPDGPALSEEAAPAQPQVIHGVIGQAHWASPSRISRAPSPYRSTPHSSNSSKNFPS